MLDALKRLLSRRAGEPDWTMIGTWAQATGYSFKRAREGGFVIEGQGAAGAWRLELGPPSRDYIDGPELRMIADVPALPAELQMLVLSRTLALAFERETFARFTDSLQTYADDSAPEEMRWVAMLPKVDVAALGPLRSRFAAVATKPACVEAWIGGEFGRHLLHATTTLAAGDPPLLLLTNRGRLTLRCELTALDGGVLGGWIGLFEAALQRLPLAIEAAQAR